MYFAASAISDSQTNPGKAIEVDKQSSTNFETRRSKRFMQPKPQEDHLSHDIGQTNDDLPLSIGTLTPTREFVDYERTEFLCTLPDLQHVASFSNGRPVRNPQAAMLSRPDVIILLEKIRSDHSDTVVLKLKDHIPADINSLVLDEIIAALSVNKVCQALYAQNLTPAMFDPQLIALTEVLKKGKIWCLNLGENYNVSTNGWVKFCNALPATHVTHLYVSEHTIKLALKNDMRYKIRQNRLKHNKHCSTENLAVIVRCTNMWWNPINAIKHQLELSASKAIDAKDKEAKTDSNFFSEPEKSQVLCQDPNFCEYWVKGLGEGGDTKWRFDCFCGEVCSWYENVRYHPQGRMFECTNCSNWSHSECVMSNKTYEELMELTEVFCHKCRTKVRRQRKFEMDAFGFQFENGILTQRGVVVPGQVDEVREERGICAEDSESNSEIIDDRHERKQLEVSCCGVKEVSSSSVLCASEVADSVDSTVISSSSFLQGSVENKVRAIVHHSTSAASDSLLLPAASDSLLLPAASDSSSLSAASNSLSMPRAVDCPLTSSTPTSTSTCTSSDTILASVASDTILASIASDTILASIASNFLSARCVRPSSIEQADTPHDKGMSSLPYQELLQGKTVPACAVGCRDEVFAPCPLSHDTVPDDVAITCTRNCKDDSAGVLSLLVVEVARCCTQVGSQCDDGSVSQTMQDEQPQKKRKLGGEREGR